MIEDTKENVAVSMCIYLYFSLYVHFFYASMYTYKYTHTYMELEEGFEGKMSKWNLGSSKDTDEGLTVLSVTTGRFKGD